MSDSGDAPDFLDRLLARHTAPRPAAVRVRPRLPGPFERVEAVRDTAPVPEAEALQWPAITPPSAVPPAQVRRTAAVETRSHTERERTVVHTEQRAMPPAPAVLRPEVPLLRPVAPVVSEPRPLPDAGRRTAGQARPERSRTAAPVPIPPGTGAPPRIVAPAPVPPCPARRPAPVAPRAR
ncbi:hypothetical protein AB0D59_28595, partial [Streptomyces sp. NPDC048417]